MGSLIDRLEQVHGRARFIARFDPMDELVSCILSQHTTDVNSFPAFTRLLEHYPSWEEAASAPVEQLTDVIRGAGLANQKAKNIQSSLRMIFDAFGAFNLDSLREMTDEEAHKWLTRLPGVGPKTASIVLCFAMGRNSLPVDTHVYRVSWRLGLIPEGIGEKKAHDCLNSLMRDGMAFRFHVALIQHGRTICRAPLPDCEPCPLSSDCHWYSVGGPSTRKAELATARRNAK